MRLSLFALKQCIIKQLLDAVFVISEIIKVSVTSTKPSSNNWRAQFEGKCELWGKGKHHWHCKCFSFSIVSGVSSTSYGFRV